MSADERLAPSSSTAVDAPPGGVGFWIAVVVGWVTMGFGLTLLLLDGGVNRIVDVGTWVVGLDLVHDLLLAPVATAVAIAVVAVLPRRRRAPLLWGLGTSVVVLLLAWPLLGGFGRSDNPTELPLDYPTAVATVLGVVWGTVAAWYGLLAVRARPARRRPPPAGATDGQDCAA